MIATIDDRIADEARIYRDQGKERFDANWHVRLGHNWRLSEVQAAIGLVQLRRLEEFIETKPPQRRGAGSPPRPEPAAGARPAPAPTTTSTWPSWTTASTGQP
jgi:DegT/DnrJ/EryC1/StrS aminotransferase family